MPFQVRLLKAKAGESTSALDSLEGIEFSRLARFNTPLDNTEAYNLNTAGWGQGLHNCYFFPNPVVTTGNGRLRRTYKHSGKMNLAALFFLPIDIDFNLEDGFGYEEAMELIDALPLKPDVIVYTGNGIQIYWSLKHQYIFPSSNRLIYPDLNLQIQSSSNIEQRAVTLLKTITKLVRGDQGPSHAARGIMRIPETYNFKIKNGEPQVTKGHYIYGSLADSYHYPKNDLEELIECYCPEHSKKCNSAVDLKYKDNYTYQYEKRPYQDLEGIDEAFSLLCKKLNLSKAPKNMFIYFKLPYGYRNLYRYMEHRESDQKSSGLSRRDLEKWRGFFIENGLVQRLSKHDYKKNISAFYKQTDKFYQYIEQIPKVDKCAIEQVAKGTYRKGESNQKMFEDKNRLKALGISKDQAKIIIINKIERRSDKRNYQECMRRLDYLTKNW
ncbi:MAG: hypothetical protein GY909_01735 [Oligoflexia bacterium]|nr:hypothetical protein [Oligoflexia bacterium]